LQTTLQFWALPVIVSMVQAFESLQVVGQLPSQVSPASTTPLPQLGEQSLSFVESQPAGQQPSPFWQVEMFWWAQATLQLAALPVIVSMVQAFWSSQVVGQLPSQVSPGSTTPLPQLAEQSLSLPLLQFGGQQPSPSAHWVIVV